MIKRKCIKCGREWKCFPTKNCVNECKPLCLRCFIEEEKKIRSRDLKPYEINILLNSRCFRHESDEYKLLAII